MTDPNRLIAERFFGWKPGGSWQGHGKLDRFVAPIDFMYWVNSPILLTRLTELGYQTTIMIRPPKDGHADEPAHIWVGITAVYYGHIPDGWWWDVERSCATVDDLPATIRDAALALTEKIAAE